jgi:hypothetical protein
MCTHNLKAFCRGKSHFFPKDYFALSLALLFSLWVPQGTYKRDQHTLKCEFLSENHQMYENSSIIYRCFFLLIQTSEIGSIIWNFQKFPLQKHHSDYFAFSLMRSKTPLIIASLVTERTRKKKEFFSKDSFIVFSSMWLLILW